jgi:hypothetical protein
VHGYEVEEARLIEGIAECLNGGDVFPSEVSVVGRVTAVTMSIEEERFVPLEEAKKGPTTPKK